MLSLDASCDLLHGVRNRLLHGQAPLDAHCPAIHWPPMVVVPFDSQQSACHRVADAKWLKDQENVSRSRARAGSPMTRGCAVKMKGNPASERAVC
jgi:hypothetical protein